MEINQSLLNLINILLTFIGGAYAARLLYKQVRGKSQGDATNTLSDTIIDQNSLIENLQKRNNELYDARNEWNSQRRRYDDALRFIVGRYRQYAPLDTQTADLERMASFIKGENGQSSG